MRLIFYRFGDSMMNLYADKSKSVIRKFRFHFIRGFKIYGNYNE